MPERPHIARDMSDAERRIANVARYATIAEASYGNPPRVRVRDGETLSNWLPFTTSRAGGDRSWHPPEVGEQVIVLAPGGDLNAGCVIGTLYRDAAPAPGDRATLARTVYDDGTVVEYDREAHTYLMDVNAAGRVTINIGGSSIVMDQDKIVLTSNGSTLCLDASGIKLEGARIDLN